MQSTKSYLIPILSYIVLLFVGMYIYGYVANNHFWDDHRLLYWDSGHYFRIKNQGYGDILVAFFPLFPLLWRTLGLSLVGICLFNAGVFATALTALAKEFRFTMIEVLLCLSLPSGFFFFVPYTESLFFFTSILILIGFHRENEKLICLGLFLCTLTRPAYSVFVPALMLMAIMGSLGSGKVLLQKLASYFGVILVATLLVAYIQFLDTGRWFEFFAAQKHWDNELRFPRFPFSSYGNSGMILRLDAMALLLGTCAGVFLLYAIYRIYKLKASPPPKALSFSLAYLAGMTLLVLAFRGGSLFSINRFVFATPFFMFAMHSLLSSEIRFSWKETTVFFFSTYIIWLPFKFFVHIILFLLYTFLSCYTLTILLLKSENKYIKTSAFGLLFVGNLVFQIILFLRFMRCEWIA